MARNTVLWSIVENKRCAGDKVVQRHVLYLGEINDQQQAAWPKTIEIFEHGQTRPRTVALFPEDRAVEVDPWTVRTSCGSNLRNCNCVIPPMGRLLAGLPPV